MNSCCFEGLESAWIWITTTTKKNLKWSPKYFIMGMLFLKFILGVSVTNLWIKEKGKLFFIYRMLFCFFLILEKLVKSITEESFLPLWCLWDCLCDTPCRAKRFDLGKTPFSRLENHDWVRAFCPMGMELEILSCVNLGEMHAQLS